MKEHQGPAEQETITNSIFCGSPGETSSEAVVILLWVIAQHAAGCARDEGAGRPHAAWLDVRLRDGWRSRSCVGSGISSGGGQGLVENCHSVSPVHPAQAPWHHVCREGAAWGDPPSPALGRPRTTAVGLLPPTAKQMVGVSFQSLLLPKPHSVCALLTQISGQLSRSASEHVMSL